MSVEVLAAFAAAVALLALTPGPAMSLIIANATSHGTAAGLWTVAGNTVGFAGLVTVAALGMHSVMVLMAEWFDVIRWLGAAYLIWLGMTRLLKALRHTDLPEGDGRGTRGWFWQGMFVAVSNPKVLLFLGAFLPQFVDPASEAGPQLALLAILFVVVLTIIDAGYAVMVGQARRLLSSTRLRVVEGVTGAALVAGGLWLALARRA